MTPRSWSPTPSGCRKRSAPALAALSPSDLDRRLVPLPMYWGEGEPYEISIREALLHVVEHASLHLGQLQLTRDLALGQS